MHKKMSLKGFSLIEILIVIALMAILATITIAAINPSKNFAAARDTQRSADVNAILNAVTQYLADGKSLNTLTTTTVATCPATSTIGSPAGVGVADLTGLTSAGNDYLVAIPMDPNGGTVADTGYTICQTSTGRIQIDATAETPGKVISVKR